jgi:hydroxymethylglutaryl-CoA lyase
MIADIRAGTVRLREVLPRDGLQDYAFHVPATTKIAIVERLHAAGMRWIEVTSMVHPKWVPQFSDAEQVLAAVNGLDGLVASAFVPNRRGLDRAVGHGVDEASLAVAATDTLSRENFAMDRAEALTEILRVVAEADSAGIRSTVTIGAAFGCPYEGPVAADDVVELVRRLVDSAVSAVFVADTIGCATEGQVPDLVAQVVAAVPDRPVGVHLHGAGATADVIRAVDAGARIVDSSTTGLGGCPFVPDAPGNVATELVIAGLVAEGVDAGLDLDAVTAAAHDINRLLQEVSDHVPSESSS